MNLELKKVQKQFNRVLSYSQNIDESYIHTDELFKTWKANKARFIDFMGGLTYTLPDEVVFELDSASKDEKVNQFVEWIANTYDEKMYQFFIDNVEAILENKLKKPWHGFPTGMKLSKVLMQEFGTTAEHVRQKLAMLIQSNKVSGRLVISVHPLDFLSASENNHGWRSCHALDGEYRAGNISYMLDNCTFIAYLKTDAPDTTIPFFPPDVPWNDKKWRCFFFMDWQRFLCYAGRQYPFFNETALEKVSEAMKNNKYFIDNPDMIPDYMYSLWDENCIPPNRKSIIIPHHFHPWGIKADTNINGRNYYFEQTKVIAGYGRDLRIVPLKQYIRTHSDAMCYNDLLDSHTYAPWIMKFIGEDEHMPLTDSTAEKLTIGAYTPCICCGDHVASDSNTFLCSRCRDRYEEDVTLTCDRCGCILEEDEAIHFDDEYLCSDCFHEKYQWCDHCGQWMRRDSLTEDKDGYLVCYLCGERI